MRHTRDAVIRTIRDGESTDFCRVAERSFGEDPPDATIAAWRRSVELERFVAADLDGQIVGTAGAFGFDMALPGGVRAGCAGVTAVSVRQDHRRRGLLRRLLGAVIDDARERGEMLAALWASEASIYPRFGFGAAIPTQDVTLERAHAALRDDLAGEDAEVALVETEDALGELGAIHEAARDARPGMLSRDDARWHLHVVHDPAEQRDGAGPRDVALVPGRGYALFRLKPAWTHGVPDGTVVVEELVALDPGAHAALWRFVADTDLSARLVAARRPVDDPLPTMLVDRSRARRVASEPLYLRLLDVAAALGARRYGTDGTLVVDVVDAWLGDQSGRFAIEVADGHGHCAPTRSRADLSVDAEALASIYLGGVRPSVLAAAGRIDVADPDALARADAMFATTPMPWHTGEF